jgi:hypothetical protein
MAVHEKPTGTRPKVVESKADPILSQPDEASLARRINTPKSRRNSLGIPHRDQDRIRSDE